MYPYSYPPLLPPYYPPPPKRGMLVAAWAAIVGGAVLVLLIVGGVDAIRATHVTDSASYHQGYARAQRADQNDWPEVRSSGSTATMLCSFAAGFDKPENAGDYVRGCTDGMHARGMRP